ncbi:MAG TPA: hypothetical protein PKY87_15560 [Terricaulis sp.]|nr:hypothetical protein [Terricaulis sp.]HRE45372.1 hypothetical protein [Terricaulis sp.]
MLRIIILLLIIAGVAGYFTRPEEPAMREAANAVLRDPGNLTEGLESIGATVAGDRVYSNYYVASKYSVSLDGRALVDCWGAFTQVKCDRAAQS